MTSGTNQAEERAELRYGNVIIMADQDPDGYVKVVHACVCLWRATHCGRCIVFQGLINHRFCHVCVCVCVCVRACVRVRVCVRACACVRACV